MRGETKPRAPWRRLQAERARRLALTGACVAVWGAGLSAAQGRPPTSSAEVPGGGEAAQVDQRSDEPPLADAFERRLRAGGASPLSAERAARRAVAASAEARAQARAVDAERAQSAQAGLAWWPRLTVSARYTRYSPYEQPSLGPFVAAPGVGEGPVPPNAPLVAADGTFPAFVNNYNLQAQLVAPLTDYLFKISAMSRSAQQSTRAAELRERAVRLEVAAAARLAYYAAIRARLSAEVADATLVSATAQQAAAQSRFELGKSANIDVLEAQARRVAAEGLVQSAGLEATRAEAELKSRMGARVDEVLSFSEEVLQPLPASPLPSLAQLQREAQRRRLEVEAYDAAAEALDEQSAATRAEALPRVDLFANAYYANPNLRYLPPQQAWRATWDAGAQLVWTPNDWALADARAQRTESLRSQQLAERDALQQALEREVSDAWAASRDADVTVPTASARREVAEEAYRVRREMYDYGKATIAELLAAETEVVRARLDWVQAVIGQRVARVRLEHALGRDVR